MLRLTVFTTCLFVVCWPSHARCEDPANWSRTHTSELVEVYRDFHRHPELSNQEERTAARLAEFWEKAGLEVHRPVGRGVVGIVKNGTGQTVMLRTDLDALPLVENTGLVYASQEKVLDRQGGSVGVMHACGHDIHIANLIGVAQYLASHKDQWSGTLVFVGQPAEERGLGAKQMLEDGLFTRFPRPEVALALHVDATLEAGKIGYRAGPTLANVDSVDITMHGRGGHGAAPNTTIDPIVQAAQLVLALQPLVSRENDPVEPAVVTVASIHAGSKHNIIPDSCLMQLTVRSFSDEVHERLLEGIRRKAEAVAAGAAAPKPTVVVLGEHTPALVNDGPLLERLLPVLRKTLGESNVVPSEPSMGGEDFSRYGRAGVPICMLRLGSVESHRLAGLKRGGGQPPSLHSAMYYPDADKTLPVGITTLCTLVLDLLPVKP
jgi:amidohydrolase